MYGKILVCMHKSDNQQLVQTDPRDALLYGIMLYTHVDERSVWYLTLGLLSSFWNRYHSTTAYFFDPPCSSIFTCIGALGTPQPNVAPRWKVFTGFPLQLMFAKVIR